jgi:soluble lytic murein transglycosylase
MQLVPATAAKLARAEGLEGFDAEQLFDPSVNVALGSRHLGALLELFHGDLDAAIASYNAGEDKVAAWWAGFERDGVAAAERVERIPYRETRQYVRRVRDAMGWYAWLLDAEAPAPGPPPAPEQAAAP